MKNMIILRNAIKCNHCGDVIESYSVHDFKYCSCETVFVDGGHEYLRRGFKNSPEDFTDLSETKTVINTDDNDDNYDRMSEIEERENFRRIANMLANREKKND